MNRLTLGTLRPTIAKVLGSCSDDARIPGYVNQAQERMMARGKWVGSVQTYRICATNNCIVWPRQVVGVEAVAVCDCPRTIRDRWYEYLPGGFGIRSGGSATQLIDRDTTVVFDQPELNGSVLNVRSLEEEAVGAYVILQGYDWQSRWVRTEDDGTLIDGEKVVVSAAGQLSATGFSRITGAIKTETNGPVLIYEYANGSNYKELAYYETDETLPVYRQSFMPGLDSASSCCGESSCVGVGVTAVVRLRHIPVARDNDFLILGNSGAFKMAVQAILKEERNLFDEAHLLWEGRANPLSRKMENGVFPMLQAELSEYQGEGTVKPMAVAHPSLFGAGGIEPLVGRGWGS